MTWTLTEEDRTGPPTSLTRRRGGGRDKGRKLSRSLRGMRGCHAVVAVTKIAPMHLQVQRWWPTKARAGPVSDDVLVPNSRLSPSGKGKVGWARAAAIHCQSFGRSGMSQACSVSKGGRTVDKWFGFARLKSKVKDVTRPIRIRR